MPLGIRERMPAKSRIEIPLPMPFSLICSPSHIISAEPAVKTSTMTIAANHMPKPLSASGTRALYLFLTMK